MVTSARQGALTLFSLTVVLGACNGLLGLDDVELGIPTATDAGPDAGPESSADAMGRSDGASYEGDALAMRDASSGSFDDAHDAHDAPSDGSLAAEAAHDASEPDSEPLDATTPEAGPSDAEPPPTDSQGGGPRADSNR